jgi:hypothetical protein
MTNKLSMMIHAVSGMSGGILMSWFALGQFSRGDLLWLSALPFLILALNQIFERIIAAVVQRRRSE